jgi:hypothetical protein
MIASFLVPIDRAAEVFGEAEAMRLGLLDAMIYDMPGGRRVERKRHAKERPCGWRGIDNHAGIGSFHWKSVPKASYCLVLKI